MFKQPLKLITQSNLNLFSACLRHETYCTASTEPARKHKWDLVSAVCLERHPIIARPMNEIEMKVKELFAEIDIENSHKSSWELRIEREKQSKGAVTNTSDALVTQNAQDLEDRYEEELKAFQFASRTTEADENNITNSLKRKLDKTLLLLTEQKFGNTLLWVPPQGIRGDGETMRQTAERVLLDTCGPDLTARFYGNAPIGYYKYLYPRAARTERADGAKVFFFLAKYIKGNLSENIKHQWLDRSEVSEIVVERPLRNSLFQFLLPDQ